MLNELLAESLWWSGPDFLKEEETTWPVEITPVALSEEGLVEMKTQEGTILASREEWSIPFERCSRWYPLLRSVAVMLKYKEAMVRSIRSRSVVDKTKVQCLTTEECKNALGNNHLSREHILLAKHEVFKWIQAEGFSDDLPELRKLGRVAKTSQLRNLQPILDPVGLMRLNSRLKGALHLKYDVRCPILLPKNHPAVLMLIRHVHAGILEHVGGTSHTLAELNKSVWIVRGRTVVHSVIRDCVHCRLRRAAKRVTPTVAPLPDTRVPDPGNRIAAFEKVILDGAGPFLVKQGKARVKRYLIIFSCLTFRCVHVEVACSLETESFLLAFHRFVSRRGVPLFVRSDNGTNFRRGELEIRECWNKLDPVACRSKYPEIEWEFSPPFAPHTNGAIERIVGSVKRGLAAVMVPGDLDHEMLETMAIKVEGIINSRPLTYLSGDGRDFKPITPNDFLLPVCARDLAPLPEGDSAKANRKLRVISEHLDGFWNRFITEYIPALNSTGKWHQGDQDLCVGDVVAVLERNERRWPLGKILEVFPNQKDNKVRTVDVLTNGKVYRRHVRGLMKLLPEGSSGPVDLNLHGSA